MQKLKTICLCLVALLGVLLFTSIPLDGGPLKLNWPFLFILLMALVVGLIIGKLRLWFDQKRNARQIAKHANVIDFKTIQEDQNE
jgi:hypothetical protein